MNDIDRKKKNRHFILFLVIVLAIPLYIIIHLIVMLIPIPGEIHDPRLKAALIRPLLEGIIILLVLISVFVFAVWKATKR